MIQITLVKKMYCMTGHAAIARQIELPAVPPLGAWVNWHDDYAMEIVREVIFQAAEPIVGVGVNKAQFDNEAEMDHMIGVYVREGWVRTVENRG